ncbi:hypothetical protein [Microbacterium sp. NPDC091662]|uniref:hypothetical protein n=1 Tax=Microbacterium sp. NPDC091662 TaxID=3364211 RepID=UPI0037FBC8C4
MTKATLPGSQYSSPNLMLESQDRLTITMIEEHTGKRRDFEFGSFPGTREITRAFAEGFLRATAPGGSRRTIPSAASLHGLLRIYCRHLAEHPFPPAAIGALRPFHLASFRSAGDKHSVQIVHSVRLALKHNSDLPQGFSDLLVAPMKNGAPGVPVLAYSPSEFRAIRRATRSILRSALERVRAVEREIEASPTNSAEFSERESFLHHAASTGDICRTQSREGVALPGATRAAIELFPSMVELSAGAVLLQCITGHNIGTILNLSTDHHRADNQETESPTILVRGRKPRRGRYRAELDLAFDSTDVWHDGDVGRDDFNSAAGVYRILNELGRRTRALSNTTSLFVGYSQYRRLARSDGTLQGCRPLDDFSQHARRLRWTHRDEQQTGINSMRVRRAFLQQRQRPVDHTVQTFADTYLRRENSALRTNQRVVADALEAEVSRAAAFSRLKTLSRTDVENAASDPKPLARELGIAIPVLNELLAGELDTIGAACVDNLASPFGPAGAACSASFLMCFGCANARAEPRHAPVQRALLLEIDRRRLEMPPADWDSRFGTLRQQVDDVLRDFGSHAEDEAPEGIEQVLADLLDGRLDLR